MISNINSKASCTFVWAASLYSNLSTKLTNRRSSFSSPSDRTCIRS